MPEAHESEFEANLAYKASSQTPKDTQENPVLKGGGGRNQNQKGKIRNQQSHANKLSSS